MRKKLIFFLLIHSALLSASIDDVSNMNQISPGVWDISCNNDQKERATTSMILNDNLCVADGEASKCVAESRKMLPSREIDDKEEIDALINACRVGTDYTHKCVMAFGAGLNTRDKNELPEILKMVNTCVNSSDGVKECVSFGTSRIENRFRSKFELRMKIVSACSGGSVTTTLCLNTAVSSLIKNEIDEVEEVVELITACAKSSLEIDTCILEEKSRLKNPLLYDQRQEMLQIIKKCNTSQL